MGLSDLANFTLWENCNQVHIEESSLTDDVKFHIKYASIRILDDDGELY